MEIDKINNEIIIQPCSPKKLAAVYGVSTKVLRTWLRQLSSLHQKRNRVYDLQQLLEIIELIGLPIKQNLELQPDSYSGSELRVRAFRIHNSTFII